MATVTLDQMRDRLLTLEQVEGMLSETEPLASQVIEDTTSVHFTLDDDWNRDLDEIRGTEAVSATMDIDGTERPLSKDALLMAAAKVGLSGAYMAKTPGSLIQPHLNYWYSEANREKDVMALSVGDVVSAFTRPTLIPFSNVSLLEAVVGSIRKQYGSDTEILADYKIHNSLEHTDIRLIIPDRLHSITGGGLSDVPSGESDIWSAGVHLYNSLVGKGQTTVESYLFRWWCTNGATTTLTDVGTWSRRSNGQNDAEVYLWAQEAVDEVLGGMEGQFASVQALTGLGVAGNVADILREIFADYNVPVSQRSQITDALLESETLSMYSIMNAITQTANSVVDNPRRADRLMRVGGAIPTKTFDTLKARVWAEGHQAEPSAANPYVITALN